MKYLIILLVGAFVSSCTKPVEVKENATVKKRVYYRIKQVDCDGKESYSPVVSVVEVTKK